MNTSKLKEFFRRDWQTFMREFFAKPSLWVIAPLIIGGAILLTRSYRTEQRYRAETERRERVVRQIEQRRKAALRELDRVLTNSLPLE